MIISELIRKFAYSLTASFEEVVKETWYASDTDPKKFSKAIAPLLDRFSRSGIDSIEEKQKRDAILKGTNNRMKMIKGLQGKYSVVVVY